ncbi:WD40-repeat-containing domain protein, partial [Ganoderma leucocontextum]
MQHKYKEIAFMTGGHTKGITAVKFNPEGTMLATAGLDAKICLWEVPLGKLLHETNGNSPITSLQWLARDVESIIFGSKDGNLSTLSLTADCSIVGFWAHTYPVEHIAIHGDLVASGALSELKVW